MKDLKGREYARVGAVQAGDKVQADGDFRCIPANRILTVSGDKNGLYIPCRDGRHYLDGQIERRGNGSAFYMGLYPQPQA
jgi:hypothetical protein